ncbi:MAG: hypothetical protein KQA41_00295 [Candidatus Aenigmarchaeota archaeon]|nr:hypothetical protein [Candidatus Aenigmarchaeota archaeon]
MFCKYRKGIGTMLGIAIFLVVLAICLALFIKFFRYTIVISEREDIKKDRDSLLFLSIINKEYTYGNFVVALSTDPEKTIDEISQYIKKFSSIESVQTNNPPLSRPQQTIQPYYTNPPLSNTQMSIYYYYNFNGKEATIYYISNGLCFNEPMKCKKYTYINRIPIPKIYDGKEFVSEGIFISFA